MNLRYREWAPHPGLAGHVRCLWALEHPAGLGEPERVLPDGCAEFVLHYGDRFVQHAPEAAEPLPQPRSLLVTAQRRFMLIEPSGRAGMIGVRFAPGAVRHFTGMPLDRFGCETVAAADLWGREGVRLEDRVREASDDRARAATVEDFLLRRFEAASPSAVDAALQAIESTAGRVRVRDLARATHVSPRTLERRFRGRVGLTPKELCRIVRFKRVLQALQDPQPGLAGWADVAASLGFADQAHLTRDFREIAGLPPDAFRRERHDYTNLFVAGT